MPSAVGNTAGMRGTKLESQESRVPAAFVLSSNRLDKVSSVSFSHSQEVPQSRPLIGRVPQPQAEFSGLQTGESKETKICFDQV